jgi:PAS domain S-box-containing protein
MSRESRDGAAGECVVQREADNFKRAVLDAVSANVAVLDRDGGIVAVNEPWRAFARENAGRHADHAPGTGVGANYLEVCRVAAAIGAEGARDVHDGILSVLRGEAKTFSYEYPCHAPDRLRWFLLTVSPLGGAHGGAVVSHTDITASRRLSEELRAAHEQLALAQESAGAGIWDWDMLSDRLEWSAQLFRLFGLDPARADASFEAWRRVVYAPDLEAAEQRIRNAVERRSVLKSEYRIVLPSGEVRWISALGRTLCDGDGRAVRMAGICLDVTERRTAEQRLFDTSQRLQALMDALPVGVSFSEDRDCHQVAGNATLLAQFEVTPQDNVSASAPQAGAAGRKIRYLQDGRELDAAELPLQRAAAEGAVIPPMELEIQLPSGRHWFAEASGAPLRDACGEVVGGVAVVADITARKRAEQALREADRRKDEFLAMLAHELRNPLASIRNAVHIMGRIGLADPRLRWANEVVEHQVSHLARLVDDLLDVSRIVRGKVVLKKETVAVATVVEQAVAATSAAIDSREQRLAVHLPKEPILLSADPVRLAQVLLNLLDNASKFSEPGAVVVLEVRCAGDEAVIEVRDNGCGIPAALLPHVFDLFQQGEASLDRPLGGLGIGLTVVKRLVDLHGGRIEATSPGPGRGSTFTIWLPTSGIASAAAGSAVPEPGPTAARTRVLVVDDDPAVAASTALWLEFLGHEVRVARTGPAAIEQALSFRPAVVLLDIGLAGMDGYEAARRLRELPGGRDLYLLAVTGYGHEVALARSKAAGFDHHLVKPFDPATLGALISGRE